MTLRLDSNAAENAKGRSGANQFADSSEFSLWFFESLLTGLGMPPTECGFAA